MNMNRFVVVVAVIQFAMGCDTSVRCGPGTEPQGDLCVAISSTVDAGATPTTDAGIDKNAVLVVRPRVVGATGLASCTGAGILRDDGTVERLSASDSFEVTVANTGIALVGESADCLGEGQFALIGVAPGTTRAKVVVRRPGLVATADVTVAIFSFNYNIRASLRSVAVGGEVGFPGMAGSVRAEGVGPSVPDLADCDCRLVLRWLSLESGSPAILTVSQLGSKFIEYGVAPGVAQVTVRYTPSGSAAKENVQQVRVGSGALAEVTVMLGENDGVFPPRLAAIGDCFSASAIANLLSDRNYFDAPRSGVTWNPGAGLQVSSSGNPGRICTTAPGPATLTACYQGFCGSANIIVPGGPTVTSLIADVRDANVLPGGGGLASVHVCPRVRLSAVLDDQTNVDVTASAHVQWRATWGSDWWIVNRAVRPDGSTVIDPAGNPCLYVGPPGGIWANGTARFTVFYLERSATFDQVFTFP
jgi:hypothetical protein